MDAIFQSALSSSGTPLLTNKELWSLLNLAHERTALIDILEVYRLTNGLEVPCVQYGIYSGEFNDITKGFKWPEKVDFHISEVRQTLSELNDNISDYRFNVWIIENSETRKE